MDDEKQFAKPHLKPWHELQQMLILDNKKLPRDITARIGRLFDPQPDTLMLFGEGELWTYEDNVWQHHGEKTPGVVYEAAAAATGILGGIAVLVEVKTAQNTCYRVVRIYSSKARHVKSFAVPYYGDDDMWFMAWDGNRLHVVNLEQKLYTRINMARDLVEQADLPLKLADWCRMIETCTPDGRIAVFSPGIGLWHPETGEVTKASLPPPSFRPTFRTVLPLPTGNILVVGFTCVAGNDCTGHCSSTHTPCSILYSPSEDTWSGVQPMKVWPHGRSLLPFSSSTVVLTDEGVTVSLYDIATNTWEAPVSPAWTHTPNHLWAEGAVLVAATSYKSG